MALQGHINHLSNQHKKIEDIINHEMSNPDWTSCGYSRSKSKSFESRTNWNGCAQA